MAVDPVAPVQPVPTLQQDPKQGQGYSPEAIKQLRDYANALMKERSPQMKFYTWANALDDVARSLTGASTLNKINNLERGQGAYEAAVRKAANPYLQGSSDNSNNAAGAGGPATATPFYQPSPLVSSTIPGPHQVASPQPAGPQEMGGTQGMMQGAGAKMAALGSPSSVPAYPRIPYRQGNEDDDTPPLDPKFIEAEKRLEGFAGKSYPDYQQHSVGYGTRAKFPGEMLNKDQAESRLQDELWKASKVVDGLGVPMTKGQREALVDLTFNAGPKWVNSGLGQAVKSGDWRTATNLFQQYNHAGGNVIPDLVSRRAAGAQAMAGAPDVGLTKDAVDYYRTKNAAARVAQAGPPSPSLYAKPHAWDAVTMYNNLASDLRRSGMPLAEAERIAGETIKNNLELMPKGNVNEYGLPVWSQAGRLPTIMPGAVPGHPGKITPIPGVPGAMLHEQIITDPVTGQPKYQTEIVRPNAPGASISAPSSTSSPPASAPGLPGGVTPSPMLTTAPPKSPVSATPPAASPAGGMITGAPPVAPPVAPPPATASAAPTGTLPPIKGNPMMRLASLAAGEINADPSETSPEAIKRLPSSNPPEKTPNGTGWRDYLDRSEKLAVPPPATGMEQPSIYDTRQDITTYPARMKMWEAAGTEQAKKNIDIYSKWLESIHDTGQQARKQMPALKQSLYILDHPELGLEQGPFAPAITTLKAMGQEAGRIGLKYGLISKDFADKLAKGEGGEANQILEKNRAALTLENLRGMLGPNSGQFRQYEMQLMSKALGSEDLSPGAQKTVMNIIDRINDRNSLFDEMATAWENKYGALDPRFKAAVVKFDLDHPTFTPEEFNKNMKVLDEGSTKPTERATPLGVPPPSGGSGLPSPEDIQRERERRRAR